MFEMKRRLISIIITVLLLLCAVGCNKPASAGTAYAIDYDNATVSYLGPEGTYTQEACGVFFEGRGSYIPCETVNAAVDMLLDGDTKYAVIPQENTIGGPVTEYVDILLDTPDVSVIGEVELPITQNLLALPGTELSDIRTVYSHKQGIAQGKQWLEDNLPNAEVIETSSTAEGAKIVSESNDKSIAAIGSAACADVYGLEVLAAGIQNNESNKTRFYVLSNNNPATAASERLAFIAKGDASLLPDLMKEMKNRKMNLVALHDRPLATELGQYYYLIECKDCDYDDYLSVTKKSGFDFRFLGCFDVK